MGHVDVGFLWGVSEIVAERHQAYPVIDPRNHQIIGEIHFVTCRATEEVQNQLKILSDATNRVDRTTHNIPEWSSELIPKVDSTQNSFHADVEARVLRSFEILLLRQSHSQEAMVIRKEHMRRVAAQSLQQHNTSTLAGSTAFFHR
uniref:Uncharacterized protein n=1 Tax=Lotharella oceanica TaxID=641309 RepID=A0A7S2XH50_9EUKA|mmetsp:Transcript_56/g.128  ORF Transcript_56/g.128 Transcript_56/m.128 type:complete len:146 (+) Transcript_56:3-440(+)